MRPYLRACQRILRVEVIAVPLCLVLMFAVTAVGTWVHRLPTPALTGILVGLVAALVGILVTERRYRHHGWE